MDVQPTKGDQTASMRPGASFRSALTAALLAVVAVVVTPLAALSWDTGHRGIDQTTQLLGSEVASALDEDLSDLFGAPVHLVDIFAGQARRGELSFDDMDRMRHALHDALVATSDVSFLAFANAEGETLNIVRVEGAYHLELCLLADDLTYDIWDIDERGDPVSLRKKGDRYVASERPWFKAAMSSTEPEWSDVYAYFGTDQLVLDASLAVRDDDGALLGVLNSGFVLSALEATLARIAEKHGAVAFVAEQDGTLLVTPGGGASERLPSGEVKRLMGSASSDPVLATASREVLDEGLTTGRIAVEGASYDVFTHRVGQDLARGWTVVVAVPRSQFEGPLRRHLNGTVLLALVALLLAGTLGVLLARAVAGPVLDVASKASRIQRGDLDVSFEPSRLREIDRLSHALGSMVTGLEERDRMRDAFSRYVSPRLVQHVLDDPSELEPGGRLVDVAVMFTDLRGYTAITTVLGSAKTVELLNLYLERMLVVVDAHGGFVTDMLGDGLLIVFGIDRASDAAVEAVQCGMEMQEALDEFAAQTLETYEVRVEMGIGVHFGEVVLGNLGTATRVKYGVVGDVVNTAARVESLTVGGELLVTDSVLEACGDRLAVGPRRDVPVKGKREPLQVYGVRALDGKSLDSVVPAAFTPVEIVVDARRLEGKRLSDSTWPVRVVAVEARFLRIVTDVALEVGDDLRLDSGEESLYGRVREVGDEILVRCTGGTIDPMRLADG
jgi:class 3 adenylate cyclase